jgi:tetratricopeptide (TPR) repeat protein
MAIWPTAASLQPNVVVPRLAEMSRVAEYDLATAITLALRAKGDGIAHPLVHHLVALGLKEQGRFDEAIAELGLGLNLDPRDVRLMITVGFCLLELDRRQEAAQVFGVAVKLDPTSAEANYGYGWAAENIGALDAAQSGFTRALQLNPNHAHALAGLSGLEVRRGEWEAARIHAERAMALNDRQTDAPMNLARVELGVSDFDAAERRLRQIIAMPELKPQARANARIMLGDALDGARRYDEAYAAYAEGKSELRELYAPAFENPEVLSATQGVRSILTQFVETPSEAWPGPHSNLVRGPERGHAFLFGFPRSGTTLLEQLLDTHPDVVALGERPVFLDAEMEFLTRPGGVTRLAEVMGDLLEPFRVSYWKRVGEFGIDARGKVFVDKHPLHAIRLPLINKVFPNAKMIFAMRDPRDVVLSCFRRSFNMNFSMYEFNTLEGAAKYYDAVMQAAAVYFDRLPFDLHRVRYEDLVVDFEATSRGLCDFLGVQWTADLENFAQTARARRIGTPSSAQVGRGLYEEGIGQWRNYAFALEPVMPILQPWIEAFGYAPA